MHHLPEVLASLRPDGRVSYVASKGNAGDALIAAATAQVLSGMGVEVSSDAPVTLVAGGGALHPRYDCLAKVLTRLPRERRTIILPSTVSHYWPLLAEFRNLVLLARDEVTLGLARMHGVRAIPCHDAAFSFDYSPWTDEGTGTLEVMRTDGESAGMPRTTGSVDVSLMATGWWQLHDCTLAARRFVSRISRARAVRTDRLHVAIVAAMLGKDVTLCPGNYFKNRAVWEMSLRGRGVKFSVDG